MAGVMRRKGFGKMAKKLFWILALVLGAVGAAQADSGAKWVWTANKLTENGQIVIKSATTGKTYTEANNQNPSGTNVSINKTTASQPPLVIKDGGTGKGGNQWSLFYDERYGAY